MLNAQCKYAVPGPAYSAAPVETMGERIRSLRQARGLSQVQLAKAVGVTKSAVCQWEDGSTANIKLTNFMALLRALGTDAPFLIWGADRAPDGQTDNYWSKNPGRR
jgi:transcriptional regulator with XRE-family HTH domain